MKGTQMSSTDRTRPSDVSGRICEQQRVLGSSLDELSRVAKTMLTGGPVAFARGIALTRTLYDELARHIALEAEILVPALRDADAWGTIRADKLVQKLRARRQDLRRLRKSCERHESTTLGGEIDRFIDDRRSDMAHAERHVLDAGVLRDDVLGIDVDGG